MTIYEFLRNCLGYNDMDIMFLSLENRLVIYGAPWKGSVESLKELKFNTSVRVLPQGNR